MSDEILDKIKDRKRELDPIYQRQKKDVKLFLMADYKLLDSNGNAIPDAQNITVNNPATFAENTISTLSSMNEQLEVKQSKQKEDARVTDIENFGADLDYEIDTNLLNNGYSAGMANIQWSRACLRGSIGALVMIQPDESGDSIEWDITPIDSYSFTYEYGTKGLLWGSRSIRKSATWIKEKFGKVIEGKAGVLEDYIDADQHRVYCEEEKIYEEENTYGSITFVFQQVPSGIMVDDEEAVSSQGESIFWLCRKIYPELDHMASILSSLSHKTVFNSLQLEEESPYTPKESNVANLSAEEAVYHVEKGGGYKPMPLSDINNAVRLWWSVLRELEQNGSISQANYGNIPFPLANSALVNLMASRDKILVPRIQCYALYKRQLLRIVIKQLQKLGRPFTIGDEGSQRTYDLKIFDADFSIKYRFIAQSKESLVANAGVAVQLAPFFPLRYLRTEVFQSPNPDELDRLMLVERAEKENPYLLSRAKAHALAEEGRISDALAEAYIARKILRDILMGLYQPQQQPAEKGVPSPPKEAAGGRTAPPTETEKASKELAGMGA